jgi:DNA-binding SARP family transcriptional activator
VYVRRSLPLTGKEEKAKREAQRRRLVQASAHVVTLAERTRADNEQSRRHRSRVARVDVRYRVLGPLEADVDGRPARLGSPKQRVVLALLLLQPSTLVPATRLIDGLWGDEPPTSAPNLVQGYVSGLRKALGKDAIGTRGVGYVLRVPRGALDLQLFEQLAHDGSQALERDDPVGAAALLREALALWRGPALADLADEPLLESAIARLDELRVLALERRIEADLAVGRHADVIGELERLVAEHPLRERTRGLLMTALYRSGRQAEALEAYNEARWMLVEELGIEPSASLAALQLSILRQDASLAPTAEPLREARRSILVAALAPQEVGQLAALAEPLAREPQRELLLLTTVSTPGELSAAGTLINDVRAQLVAAGVDARAAVFTSVAPGIDMARLARDNDIDLVLADAPDGLLEDARVLGLLDHAPCDVGIVVRGWRAPARSSSHSRARTTTGPPSSWGRGSPVAAGRASAWWVR